MKATVKAATKVASKVTAIGAIVFFALMSQAETFTPPLFKIEKDGNTSYILGTVRGGGEAEDLSSAAKKIVAEAQSIILDNSMENVTKEALQKFAGNGAENSLRDQLTDEEWYKFLYYILPPDIEKSANILQFAGSVAPVLAVGTYEEAIAQAPEIQSPVDMFVVGTFLKEKKGILTFQEERSFLETRVAYQTIDELKRLLAVDVDHTKRDSDDIIKAYRSSDLETLAKLTPKRYSAVGFKIAVTDRVADWAKAMDQAMAVEGEELVLLDVDKMVGDVGLLNLLAQAGYTVTAVDQTVPAPAVTEPTPAPAVVPESPVVMPEPTPEVVPVAPEVPPEVAPETPLESQQPQTVPNFGPR